MTLLSPIDDNCRGRFTTSRQSSIYPEDFEVQAVLAATFTHTTLPGASDYDGYSLFPEYSRIERLLITASECKDVAEELLEQAWERIIDALGMLLVCVSE